MMRGNPESLTVSNPQKVDKGKRNLLVRVTRLAGAGAAIYALSKTEQAYAAVKKFAEFRARSGYTHSAHSPSLDTPVTTQNISQGEPLIVQGTPTPDLQTTKTALEIKQLETPPPSWLESNIATLIGSLGTAATIGVGIWQFNKTLRNDREKQSQQQATDAANRQAQELAKIEQEKTRLDDLNRENKKRREDQRIDREKRDEDRFQIIVSGLGSNDIQTRAGAAVLMRTFLDPKYKESYRRFYQQIFDLAVVNLRLRRDPKPDQFIKEIIKLFTQSAPLVVENLREKDNIDLEFLAKSDNPKFDEIRQKSLNASEVYLEGADFIDADLRYIYMRDSFLAKADFTRANLTKADLTKVNLSIANLFGANLSEAYLTEANLYNANLERANLTKASLQRANLTKAFLFLANLYKANLFEANLSEANLFKAFLGEAVIQYANLTEANLEGANPEEAYLSGTIMWNVKNYPNQQKRQQCKDNGASFDSPPAEPDTNAETG